MIGVGVSSSIIPQRPHKNGKYNGEIKNRFSYKIFTVEGNGFGYNIYDENRIIIRQPTIPGLPGNKGFCTKSDAIKIAQLVVYKIENYIIPPSISRKELDSLNITF